MGAKYTAAQAKASNQYLKKFEDIIIRVPVGKREEYKKLAESHGKSLNQFIIECIEEMNVKTKEE